jgi:hypothetical protein
MTEVSDGYVSLYLYGDKLAPDIIEEITGFTSSRAWRKGAIKPGKRSIIAKTGLFQFEKKHVSFEPDFERQIETYLAELEPHFPLDALPGVETIKLDYSLNIKFKDGSPIIVFLSQKTISLLNASKASFEVTFYDSTND